MSMQIWSTFSAVSQNRKQPNTHPENTDHWSLPQRTCKTGAGFWHISLLYYFSFFFFSFFFIVTTPTPDWHFYVSIPSEVKKSYLKHYCELTLCMALSILIQILYKVSEKLSTLKYSS